MMRVTIIGFGNQAKAWSQNLKDSGFPIRVALRADSSSFEAAVRAGFDTVEIGTKEFFEDRAFALLTPDHTHHEFMLMNGHLLHEGSIVVYAHGYSLIKNKFDQHYPHLQHILLAPKSIATELRKEYLAKGKLGAVYSFEHCKGDLTETENWLFDLAAGIGITMGPYKASFERETQADLYSEQGLLCGLIPYVAGQMFKDLIDTGIEPELAYLECWHELKLIINAMVDKGPQGFFDLISPNALIGSEKGFERLMTNDFKNNLRSLLTDIQSGKFNDEMDNSDVETLRKTIRSRWAEAPLTKTFEQINHQGHK